MKRRSVQKRTRQYTIRGYRDPEYSADHEKRYAQVRECQNCGNPDVTSEGDCDECGTGIEDL